MRWWGLLNTALFSLRLCRWWSGTYYANYNQLPPPLSLHSSFFIRFELLLNVPVSKEEKFNFFFSSLKVLLYCTNYPISDNESINHHTLKESIAHICQNRWGEWKRMKERRGKRIENSTLVMAINQTRVFFFFWCG